MTPGFIQSHLKSASKEIERFPSLERHRKLANEHHLPLTNMLSARSIKEFEAATEEGKVIKRNRLVLEKFIIERNKKINRRLK
jgi:hypothetical protein